MSQAFHDHSQFVFRRTQGEAVGSGDVEEGGYVERLWRTVRVAARIDGGDVTMGLAECVVHFIDDPAQVAVRAVAIPEREGCKFVEQVAREGDEADGAAVQCNACLGKFGFGPGT